MKRRFNLIALVVLVSVNVFTPVSYAQENPGAVEGTTEKQEVTSENSVTSTDAENDVVVPQNQKTEENIEEPETPSAMDIISKVVEEYKETQKEGPEVDGGDMVEENFDEVALETYNKGVEEDYADTMSVSVNEEIISYSDDEEDTGENFDMMYELSGVVYGANKLTNFIDVKGGIIPLLDRNLGAKNLGESGYKFSVSSISEDSLQGYCPDGYHVPTLEERSAFIVAWCENEGNNCDIKQLNQIDDRSEDLKYSWNIDGRTGDTYVIDEFSEVLPYLPKGEGGRNDQTNYMVSSQVIDDNHNDSMEHMDGNQAPEPVGQSRSLYFSKRFDWIGMEESPDEEFRVRCIDDGYSAPTILAIDVFMGENSVDTGMLIDNEDWILRKFVDKSSISYGEIEEMLPKVNENMEGYEWKWYLDDGNELNSESLNLETISDLKIYGYYEPVKSISYEQGDITYIDTNGKVFGGMGTITFTNGENSITMLDRNLGAMTAGTGEDAYGYYFQWGNNYGFLPGENDIDTERVDVTGYGWNNPYVSNVFVVNTGQRNYSKLSDEGEEDFADGLWGGLGDYRDNTWDSSEGHDYMRQGPCPDGYHVPSGGERLNLVSLYGDEYGNADDFLAIDTKKYPAYQSFPQDFSLPYAGKMNYEYVSQEEVQIGALDLTENTKELTISNRKKNLYLWTSSPYYRFGGTLYGSRRLFLAKNAKAQSSIERAYGFPVRCFKDNYEEGEEPLVLVYDTRGGSPIQAQTIPAGENGYLPGYTTIKTGSTLRGWCDDFGWSTLGEDSNKFTDLIMKESNAEGGKVTIYAIWDDEHVVTFKDYDGSVIKVVLVRSGSAVQAPADPSRDGYKFTGWDKDLSNVSEDMEVIAQYSSSSKGGYSGGGGSSSSKSIKSHNSADEADKTVSNDEKSKGDNEEPKKEVVQSNQGKTLDADTSSKETFNAHQWAYSKGLTKYRTPTEARMDDPLNRSEMAKISSIFAEQFLDKLPNDKKQEFCSQYPDLWKVEDDMKFFIIESCKLGYMGYESNGIDALAKFRPYTPVTVAEAATILSRIVWGNDNAMNGKDWYKGHLYATYNHGLIDDIKDPTKRSITRREAYLMLYRLIND